MPNQDVAIGREYERLVFERQQTRDERWLTGHRIDWDDQPSRFKVYLDSDRQALADGAQPRRAFPDLLTVDGTTEQGALTGDVLSHILVLTNGVVSRRRGEAPSAPHASPPPHRPP